MSQINTTHDPARTSFVAAANRDDGDFPIQNLPFGVFRTGDGGARGGVAIGDRIVDLAAAQAAGLFEGEAAHAAAAAAGPVLNPLLALGNAPASALRARLSVLLASDGPDRASVEACLVPMAAAAMVLPVAVRQFTDMSLSSFHLGRMRGTDANGDPIVRPNFKYAPVGYNGRASTVVTSGTPLHRPWGQWLQNPQDEDETPVFGPEPRQDYEMELGLWIGGAANAIGQPIRIADAPDRIFGFSLLNDWSSRRIQVRETALGPFISKSMGTTIAPWIVTAEALAPFRTAMFTRPASAPALLPHLDDALDQAAGGLDVAMTAWLSSTAMRAAGIDQHVICETNLRYLHWSWAQVIAHHTSAGCDLAAGDLIGSGTCSGPSLDQAACLTEKAAGGRTPWPLPGGEQRTYLEDGDRVAIRARAAATGHVPIGFGACDGELLAAVAY